MRSLRSRLILGSSLVAVVPLAVAMFLISRRIEATVRTQAEERLNAALGALRLELQSDAERITGKLQILARDPALKRLYLVRPAGGRDLSDHLAERRFLLGLDFLEIADTTGVMVADAAAAVSPGANVPEARRVEPAGPRVASGPRIESLAGDSSLAMTASAPIHYESEMAGVVHGGRVLDAAFLAQLERTSGVELVLRNADGRTVATTLDGGSPDLVDRPGVQRAEVAGRSYLSRALPLEIGAPPHATIAGLVSTASSDQTIATLQVSSALLGAMGLGIAVLLGWLWSRQISRPVEALAAYSQRLAHGDWDEPLTVQSVRELETLVSALDRMREDLQTYRDRLVTSERQAAWSQMARKVAHEIKNPLTPIAISVADLRRSYQQQRPDFPQILDQAARTVAEEVETLKRLLQEFSDFGGLPAPRLEPCRLAKLLADLEVLYGRDVAEGRLAFVPSEPEVTISADPGQIRQALVNLIKNGLEAIDGNGRVVISTEVGGEALEVVVADSGPGLDAEQKANLFVPGFTTKLHGSGLGLTIVERIVNDHGGTIAVDSAPGRGTTFRIRLPRGRTIASHGERAVPRSM